MSAQRDTGEPDVASPRSLRREVVIVVAIAAAYVVVAHLGLSLAFATKQVTAVWPPTGLALAALIGFGPRAWPGVLLGAFVANAMVDEPVAVAAGIAVGNTLEAVVGALLLRRLGFRRELDRLPDVLGLIGLAAIGATAISATIGVASLALGGLVPWSAYRSVWWVWWVGDGLGALVVAPLLLTWSARPRLGLGGRGVELAALLATLLALCVAAFSGRLVESGHSSQLEYALFPIIIWAALRFSPREVATVVALLSAVALWATVHDLGPFASGTLDDRLIFLQLFMATAATTGLALGAAPAARTAARGALQDAHDQLEVRVRARTAELAAANDALHQVNQELHTNTTELAAKNEEVEAFVYIVSHDLRAPLVNLVGFARELEQSCGQLGAVVAGATLPAAEQRKVAAILDDDIPGALRFIRASTTKFQRLIDALLGLSRLGRQEYRSEPIDVAGLVGATVDTLRQSIAASGAVVAVGPLPATYGDTTAIGQVFGNLIGNALKFLDPARPGHIEVGGELADQGAHYWVRDNGAGLPPSAGRRLFQVFQRFHPERAAGDGMGLAIVKRVVERHGGRVWADSQEGVGTTFHLTLPAPPQESRLA